MLSEVVIRKEGVIYIAPQDRKEYPNYYSKQQLKEMGLEPLREEDYKAYVIRRYYYNYPLYDIKETKKMEK